MGSSISRYNLDNTMHGFYIAPAFMDKLVIHVSKNFMTLPNIKVPLILGIWGGKGQGKSFQCELVFAKMGIKLQAETYDG
ncbi:ribulose bisphosphate carboxylase/oxygenase activase 2, chloroplastic-like [Magnolia sinica]|uniref:ribulose bisphosphate carboxylase/oxygenase activase 2, chloroplastic-like n=1 Tax=Magnolia sinica TaxID=86752 RepID=UPI002658D8A1|nr:ribulose bisphosphate carboxylase/oxygenase activase 2, chloroplastic-like [Magnolia sinica]